MPATYEPIASQTLSSAVSSVTFNSIPGTFTDLVCVASGTTSNVDNLRFRFNSDSATNYSTTSLFGSGSAAGSYRESNITQAQSDYYGAFSTTNPGTAVISVMSYANTNVFKTVLSATGQAGTGVHRNVSLWRSTSAITSMTILLSSFNFSSGCTFALYGIKAA